MDAKPDHPNDEYWGRGNIGSIAQAPDRLEQDVPRHREQQDRVEQGGKDLQPVETERALRVRAAPRRRLNCRDRHTQAKRVGGHVAGIRQQRQRISDDPDDDLHDEKCDDQDERQHQWLEMPRPCTQCCGAVVMTVTAALPVAVNVARGIRRHRGRLLVAHTLAIELLVNPDDVG